MSNFDEAAINTIFNKVVSYSAASGYFNTVNQHEPKNAPGNGITAAVWVQAIRPVGDLSGLSATSGVLLLNERVYTSFMSQPYDMIDPNVTAATAYLMGAFSGDFDFGQDANVYAVDLLGMTGQSLEAIAGYVEMDRKVLRIMTLAVPVIVNDMFAQGA